MTRKHDYMFWLDLETTGSHLEGNTILEVGAAITDMSLNVLDGRNYVINPGTFVFELKPIVLEMHSKNGLLDEIYKSEWTMGEVDNELSQWIRKYNGSNHMLFAGSGIMHFDRKFIQRFLPLLDARLTYYAIDVGVIRRTFELLLGIPDWPEDRKDHRAFGDVLFHIDELKWALDRMRLGVV